MKKISFTIILTILLVLAGCSSPTSGGEEDLRKVTLMLDWFPNTNHTGIYTAIEKGYYEDQGIEVKIMEPGDGVSAEQVAASGEADFAISFQENITQARASGIPLVSVGAIIQENTSAFASLKESNITSPKDFENKRYGGWGSATEEAILKAVVEKDGGDYQKVNQITLGATDFFKSIGRDTDIQWIFQGWDGVEAERQGIQLNLIYLKDIDPALNYYTPVIATNEKNIQENPDLIRNFMEATAKGYNFSIEHPGEAADILIKEVPDINKELVKASQEWLSPRYQGDAAAWGIQEEEVWKRYADWLFEKGLIENNIDPEKAFTNEFLPDGNQ
ncbi:ABC transporter substrate-binding protein [Bacillus lacus]|uniref:ABC transporter substrate-binding protein n=1 Tax=Metabacillus lacus TaxID=1983721 RepID=A0A7X2J2B8_9BACI|nr:ABC transporter substrate-binding protein [Metabacillus lacus]MRX74085.1 ABC transporter substrate-binding protein [Metabacillus lacus]